jgi:hypothetical protein
MENIRIKRNSPHLKEDDWYIAPIQARNLKKKKLFDALNMFTSGVKFNQLPGTLNSLRIKQKSQENTKKKRLSRKQGRKKMD